MNESTDGFHVLNCTDGTFLSAWLPLEGVSTGQLIGRGIVYILSMAYLFVGIAYLADLFMASIEMITSSKKEVTIKDDKGQEQTIVVRVWNQTVANLTLIALGCAAPEVLLSCIEIVKNNFEAEELGPSETVASASFNLFAIIGVCIYVIPRNESRKIKYQSVFVITAIWSLFAYVWLLLITNFISPGVIEVWEAVVTLCFFPLTVLSAFLADKKSVMSSKDKTYRIHHGIIVETMQSEDSVAEIQSRQFLKQFSIETRNKDIQQFEEHRRELIVTMKNLRRRDPTMNANQLELMAVSQLLDNGTQNNAVFHIKASKKLTGLSSWRIRQESKRTDVEFHSNYHPNSNPTSAPNTPSRSNDRRITEVFFSPGHYTVDEGVGMFTATVVRRNGDLSRQVFVDYSTEDADALAGRDYGEVRGTLCFQPGQTRKTIEIPIIDDLVYEGDQHFYIRLFNLRFGQVRGREAQKGSVNPDAYLIPPDEDIDHELKSAVLKITNETATKKPVKKISFTDVERNQKTRITQNSESHSIVAVVSNETNSDDTQKPAPQIVPKKKVSFTAVADSNEGFSNQNTQTNAYSNGGQVVDHKGSQSSESTPVTSAPTTPTKKISLSGFNDFFHGIQSISTYLSSSSSSSTTTTADHSDHSILPCSLRLVCPSLATVMILDDDHHGIFTFAKREIQVSETSGTVSVQILRTGGNRGRAALTYQTEEGTAEADKDFLSRHGELIFEDGEIEKCVQIPIVANRHHDASIVFFLSISEPKVYNTANTEINDGTKIYSISHELEKEENSRIPDGHPELGEINKITIRIRKSVHFKNLVHKIAKMSHIRFKNGRTPWKQQFIDAIRPEQNCEDYEEENGKGKPISWIDYTKHCITLPWRLLFALIPPAELFGGYPTFFMCIAIIGVLVTLLGDLAYSLGCTVGLKTRVTSLALVSVGTNVPDLLASRVFAIRDATADASITNVLGSNIINVYLGVGLAWTMASIHHANKGDDLLIDPGTLYFMVILYISFALVALLALMLRRRFADGELGGPNKIKIPCTIAFISLWFTFVLVNAFQAYGYF